MRFVQIAVTCAAAAMLVAGTAASSGDAVTLPDGAAPRTEDHTGNHSEERCGPHTNGGGGTADRRAEQLDPARLDRLVRALDPGAVASGNGWRLMIEDQIVLLVTDRTAGRLRVMVPVRAALNLEPRELERMMLANFDTALDARYAISDGLVWSVFLRPLAGLDKAQLISGLAQTVILARSYGTGYTSGSLRFGAPERATPGADLMRRLLLRGRDI